jgi:hypothetical protein
LDAPSFAGFEKGRTIVASRRDLRALGLGLFPDL